MTERDLIDLEGEGAWEGLFPPQQTRGSGAFYLLQNPSGGRKIQSAR